MLGYEGPITIDVVTICWIDGDRAIPVPPSTPGMEAQLILRVKRCTNAWPYQSYFVTDGINYYKAYRMGSARDNQPYIISDKYYPSIDEINMIKDTVDKWYNKLVHID